jgi:hypothetical protein
MSAAVRNRLVRDSRWATEPSSARTSHVGARRFTLAWSCSPRDAARDAKKAELDRERSCELLDDRREVAIDSTGSTDFNDAHFARNLAPAARNEE